MDCLRCGNVSNLMASEGLGYTVRRWRMCPKCDYKFHTYEIPAQNLKNAEEFARIDVMG
jgi:transcriptional regulator NrdR family protein